MRLQFMNPLWVVGGSATGLLVCNGPMLGYTFGVFLKPIMADMHWDRGAAPFGLAFGELIGALYVVPLGWMMDRDRIRIRAEPAQQTPPR